MNYSIDTIINASLDQVWKAWTTAEDQSFGFDFEGTFKEIIEKKK